MRVEQLGSGTPEIAVVGGIHGDEPCGVHAIDRLLADDPSVTEPVKLVVANERALERGVRYVDEDLNRAFPGDPNADTHEGQLAHDLVAELEGCFTFSMHSTQSHAEPFALLDDVTDDRSDLVTQLPVTAVVETSHFSEGRLFTAVRTLEVECGLQGSETAAQNADRLTRAFLSAAGALPGDTVGREVPVFRLHDVIEKDNADSYEVFVENFTEVDAGDTFAAADGDEQVAPDSFYPVLMSPYGYRHVFGYTAEKVDVLAAPPTAE